MPRLEIRYPTLQTSRVIERIRCHNHKFCFDNIYSTIWLNYQLSANITVSIRHLLECSSKTRVGKGFVTREMPFLFPVNCEMAIFSGERCFGYIAVNGESPFFS